MANSPLDSPVPRQSALRQHNPVFALIGRIDDAIYQVERFLVTTALLIMSGVVFIDICYRFFTSMRGNWTRAQAGDIGYGTLWPIVALGLGLFGLFLSIYGKSPSARGNPPVVIGLTVVSIALCTVFAWATLAIPSSTVCTILVVYVLITLLFKEWARPFPIDTGRDKIASAMRVLTSLGLCGVLLRVSTTLPEGYAWAQRFALFLLLWMAFVGASMATHERRHLTIDAARKAVPERFLPYYNFVSNMVAFLFTLAFFYIALTYLQGRLGAEPTPGEIPDWIKVLAIPVSFGLIALRFLGQAIGALLEGLLGVKQPADEVAA